MGRPIWDEDGVFGGGFTSERCFQAVQAPNGVTGIFFVDRQASGGRPTLGF